MLSGDNGILQKATTAKENTDSAQIKERIQLAYHSALVVGKGSYTKDSLMEELKNEFKTDYDVDDSDAENWKMKAQGQEIIIPAGKEDNSKVTIKVGTTNIKDVSDLSTLYGEITDYKSTIHPNIDWQLFYADNNNYYVIASDYVPVTELPCDGNTISGITYGTSDLVAVSGEDYWARFSSTGDDHVRSSAVHSSGAESTAISENPLTNTYLKWVQYADTNNYTKNNPNMKAVAYMMDTSKWNSFADGVSGAFAIGGPTIEMLSLSWNAVDGHTPMIDFTTLSSSNANSTGYEASHPGTGSDFFGTTTNMWVIREKTKANGYYLASPSYHGEDMMIYVSWGGGVYGSFRENNGGCGFRPLVAIPKTSLK